MRRRLSQSTRCARPEPSAYQHGALHAPLYRDTTFAFPDTASLTDVMDGVADGYLYTRFGQNPTIRSTEAHLARIEGAEVSLLFGSGMAAISASLIALCGRDGRIVCLGDVYGGTYELMTKVLPAMGIRTDFVLADERDTLATELETETRLVFLETPTNPKLDVLDIAATAKLAHAAGARVVVDGTFATPVNQSPLALGADVVVHSATKFLGGHSDLTGGAVLGDRELLAPVWQARKNFGQVMAPDVAHMLARSLRTLHVRVEAQNARALELARRLEAHHAVQRVFYPGLASHPDHDVARSQMSGYGGVVTFVVDGGATAAAGVIEGFELISLAASLGGVESLATQPLTTTHRGLTASERARRGIDDGMIRLSVGLEDVEDLWEDLDRSLSARLPR